jgi:nicotinate-nucleotide adenylyltransferase
MGQNPATQVSDAESRLGATFTIDTLRLLKARYPAVKFVWIMGADSLAGFTAWRDWSDIFREVPVAVVARPGATLKSLLAPAPRRFSHARLPGGAGVTLAGARPPAWIYLTTPWNFASSTALRNSPDPVGRL